MPPLCCLQLPLWCPLLTVRLRPRVRVRVRAGQLVMLADCEQKLGNRARAHELASRALAMESRTQEDEEAHAKAAALANKTKP